jgi:hypothetical protein
MVPERLLGGQHVGLEGFGCAAALLHRTDLGFNALGEREAALTFHTLHNLIHTAIRADAESDGLLTHPRKP